MNKRALSAVSAILFICTMAHSAWPGSPNVTIKAGHYPVTIGIKGTWYSNTSGITVPVTLTFSPPWDLTGGPRMATVASAWIDKSQAYNGGNYPDAAVALQVVKPGGDKVCSFLKKTPAGLYFYGMSNTNGDADENFSFAPKFRLFFFPAKVGKAVTQRTSLVFSEGSIPMTVVTRVVAKGTVIVGAGTFNDSAMVQVKISFGGSEPWSFIRYYWIAPYVGYVAEIQSLDNETNELFTTADFYMWLRTLELP
ncbi:MAG: hypothetical protein AB1714_07785 [Acidobacteriota bacterium]